MTLSAAAIAIEPAPLEAMLVMPPQELRRRPLSRLAWHDRERLAGGIDISGGKKIGRSSHLFMPSSGRATAQR